MSIGNEYSVPNRSLNVFNPTNFAVSNIVIDKAQLNQISATVNEALVILNNNATALNIGGLQQYTISPITLTSGVKATILSLPSGVFNLGSKYLIQFSINVYCSTSNINQLDVYFNTTNGGDSNHLYWKQIIGGATGYYQIVSAPFAFSFTNAFATNAFKLYLTATTLNGSTCTLNNATYFPQSQYGLSILQI